MIFKLFKHINKRNFTFNLNKEFNKNNLYTKDSLKNIKLKIALKTLTVSALIYACYIIIKNNQPINILDTNKKYKKINLINDSIKSFLSSMFSQIVKDDFELLPETQNIKLIKDNLKYDIEELIIKKYNIDISINEIIIINSNTPIIYLLDNGKLIISKQTFEDVLQNKTLFQSIISYEFLLLYYSYLYDNNLFSFLYYYYNKSFFGYHDLITNPVFVNNIKKIYYTSITKSKIKNIKDVVNDKLGASYVKEFENYITNNIDANDSSLNYLSISNKYINIS